MKNSAQLRNQSTDKKALQNLLDSSLDVICSIDAEGRFVFVSSAATKVWGYTPEELTGRKYMDLVIAEDHTMTIAAANAIMMGMDVTSFENRYIRKDGQVVPVLWSARWSEEDQIMYGVAKDATDIKNAEKQSKLLDKRLRRAYKLAKIAWWELDVASGVYTCSEEIFTMYGLPVPENNQISVEGFLACVHPNDRPKLQHDLSSLSQDTYADYEHRIVKPTGEVIYVSHYSEVLSNAGGDPVGLHGTTKEITKEKLQQLHLEESEKKLQENSRRLSEILESIGDGFFTVDKEWTVTYWNKKAEQLLQKKREDIVGRNLWDEYQDAISLKFCSEYYRAVREQVAVRFEEYFPPLNMWIDVSAYPSAEGLSVYFKDVTEKKWQENELRNSNERFSLACKASNDVIWDWDIINNKVLRSEGFLRYGYKADRLAENAATWTDIIHPDDKEHVLQSNSIALQDCETTYWEGSYRCRKSDGSYASVIDKGCIIRDGKGQAIRMVGAMKDVTEQKEQENALKMANERYELAAKATSDALWDWDLLTNTCYFNEGFTALFGHDNRADLVYKNWINNIHDADKKHVIESLTEAMNTATVRQWTVEYSFYRHDRSIAIVLDRGFIIRDGSGKAIRMVGSMQDITKLKETEAEMNKLSLVAKETANVVILTDAHERITWVNKAFTDTTEYSFEEAIGKKPGEFLQGPKTSDRTRKYMHKCVEKRIPFHCEIVNYTKSGREYWMEVKGQPLFDEKGELQQFFAIQTDITNRKEAEAAIRLSEERYRLLFYNSPRPKWTFHAETLKVVDVNDAAIDLYGYSKQEFLRLTVTDLKLPEEKAEMLSAVQYLKSGKSGHYQRIVRHKKKTGEAFYIEISSFSIQLATGMHIIVTGTDMTEKLQLQQQVIAEKVSAQKQVARAIIHAQETERTEIGEELHDNVCQLLTTAKLYMENIKHMPEHREEFTAKGVELVMKSINEIRCLSRQLVSPVSNELGFESSVEELINHYRSMNLFEIRFTYTATIDLIDKDLKTAVIRILQEQFNNTVKYARASAVDISICNTEEDLKLRFEDNGVGFDPDIKKGIGLLNIKNRAGAYAGTVKLRTAPGEGCCMEVTFPLSQQAEFMC